MKKTLLTKGLAVVSISALLAACGGQGDSSSGSGKTNEPAPNAAAANPDEKFKDPVEVNFFYNGYSKSLMEDWQARLKEKYNIVLKPYYEAPATLIASGVKLDLIAYSAGGLFTALDLQLTSDLTDMITKYKFDMNRLAPGVLESARMYSDKKEIPVMPYELNNNLIIYNKSIFDKFGVAYPKDGMTWEQMYDIIPKVSRNDGGVQYKGFAYSFLNLIYKNQMNLPFVDPVTHKALINNDQWKKWVEVMAGFHKINGNELGGREDDLFFKEKTLAMRGGPSPLDLLPAAIEGGLDWDVVSNPRFAGMENVGGQMNAPFLAIPPSSTNRDAAFKVIMFFLSDELQAENARAGRVPVLKAENVVKEFGTKYPFLKGTNYSKAVFADTIGKPIQVTKYDGTVRSNLSVAVSNVAQGKNDVNSELRDLEEKVNKAIEEAKKK